MRAAILSCLVVVVGISNAQTITGRWTTIDDNTGKPRSVVELTEVNGTLTGRIVEAFTQSKGNKPCTVCPGDRHGQRILGLEIIRDMKRNGNEWVGGTILDPETGKVYDCKLWLENGKLQVRGYVAFFYRTQTWVR